MSNQRQVLPKQAIRNAFASEHSLLLRKSLHENYSEPSVNLPEWVISLVAWRGDERVLDVGSGPGTYLNALQKKLPLQTHYTAGDLSSGMLHALHRQKQGLKAAQLDALHLPFASGSFDVVLANHVLPYVADTEAAILELRRVLRQPHGLLITATSSDYTMPEFSTLIQRALRLLRRNTGEEVREINIPYHFSLENGLILLGRHFKSVVRYDIPSSFIFDEVQPVTDYIDSCRDFYQPYLPANLAWEEFMTVIADQVRRLVEHFGELVVNKLSGVLIATDEGGFSTHYQEARRLHR